MVQKLKPYDTGSRLCFSEFYKFDWNPVLVKIININYTYF